MSLLTCETTCSLVEFARSHGVHQRDLWLPLDAALPLRASKGATVSVDAHTPLALLDHNTGEASFDKRSICVKLHVADAVQCESKTVEVKPASVPSGFTAFVRWDRKGTKVLRPSTPVLHYVYTQERPSSVSSSAVGEKRRRTAESAGTGSVDASTLADTLRGKQHRLTLMQRSSEDLQRRLTDAIQSLPHPLNLRSLHILSSTLSNIGHRSGQPPLHFVAPAAADVVEAGGVAWTRSNRRILSRVFRGVASEERSEASKYSDGSRQLRFYFIEDVLLVRRRRRSGAGVLCNAAAVVLPPTGEAGAGTQALEGGSPSTDNDAERTSSADVEYVLKGGILADMNHYADRGYRIVWLEHYPVLHHGSRFTVDETLRPVVRLCQEVCPHLTVTVVISAMSYVTALRRQGMELSFVVPQAGLLQFFLAEMNTSLHPDPKTAAVVGCSDRGSAFLKDLHRDFARHAALRYVDVSELQEGHD